METSNTKSDQILGLRLQTLAAAHGIKIPVMLFPDFDPDQPQAINRMAEILSQRAEFNRNIRPMAILGLAAVAVGLLQLNGIPRGKGD